jgi:hypothetical protein
MKNRVVHTPSCTDAHRKSNFSLLFLSREFQTFFFYFFLIIELFFLASTNEGVDFSQFGFEIINFPFFFFLLLIFVVVGTHAGLYSPTRWLMELSLLTQRRLCLFESTASNSSRVLNGASAVRLTLYWCDTV